MSDDANPFDPKTAPTKADGAIRKRLRALVPVRAQRAWEKVVKRLVKLDVRQLVVAAFALIFAMATLMALFHSIYDVTVGAGATRIRQRREDYEIQAQSCARMSQNHHTAPDLVAACVAANHGLAVGGFAAACAEAKETLKYYWSGFVPGFLLQGGFVAIIPYMCVVVTVGFKVFFSSVAERTHEDTLRQLETRIRLTEAEARKRRLDDEAAVLLAHSNSELRRRTREPFHGDGEMTAGHFGALRARYPHQASTAVVEEVVAGDELVRAV